MDVKKLNSDAFKVVISLFVFCLIVYNSFALYRLLQDRGECAKAVDSNTQKLFTHIHDIAIEQKSVENKPEVLLEKKLLSADDMLQKNLSLLISARNSLLLGKDVSVLQDIKLVNASIYNLLDDLKGVNIEKVMIEVDEIIKSSELFNDQSIPELPSFANKFVVVRKHTNIKEDLNVLLDVKMLLHAREIVAANILLQKLQNKDHSVYIDIAKLAHVISEIDLIILKGL